MNTVIQTINSLIATNLESAQAELNPAAVGEVNFVEQQSTISANLNKMQDELNQLSYEG